MNINWYPGHMAKAKRIIKEKLSLIDIVFEVIDARIPFSSKIRDIDDYLKEKPRLLILNKYDLCDQEETKKWVAYYKTKGYNVVMLSLINNSKVDIIINKAKEMTKKLDKKRTIKGLKQRPIRVLIVGIPNVGKSTLINRLVGKKATKVADVPGVTKGLDWIKINKDFELLDSPGILWPKLDNDNITLNLAAMNIIKEEMLPINKVSFYILEILSKYYLDNFKKYYGIENIDLNNLIEIYNYIGKKRGCIIKGGEIDYEKVSSLIKKDLNNNKFGLVTFDRYDNKEC